MLAQGRETKVAVGQQIELNVRHCHGEGLEVEDFHPAKAKLASL